MSMTDEEAKNFYGIDATEWLKRWDEGRTVWTIEMGGLGPGYEQYIHIVCAEVLREMLNGEYDTASWFVDDKEAAKAAWRRDSDVIEEKVMQLPVIKDLGLSGAQWGAGVHIAGHILRHGPWHIMQDEDVKDRHIQVSKAYPKAA